LRFGPRKPRKTSDILDSEESLELRSQGNASNQRPKQI
jgi:hypothetical protein